MEYGLKYKPQLGEEPLPSNPGQWMEVRGFVRNYGLDPFRSSLLIDYLITSREYLAKKRNNDPVIDEQGCSAIEAADVTFPEWRKSGYANEGSSQEFYIPDDDMITEVDSIVARTSTTGKIEDVSLKNFQDSFEHPVFFKNFIHSIYGLKKAYSYDQITGYHIGEEDKFEFDEKEHSYIIARNIGYLAVNAFVTIKENLSFDRILFKDYAKDWPANLEHLEGIISGLLKELESGELNIGL